MEVLIGYAIFSVFTLVGILVPSGTERVNPKDITQGIDQVSSPATNYKEPAPNNSSISGVGSIVTNNSENNKTEKKRELAKQSHPKFIAPVKKVQLRSKFGYRVHPILKKKKFHYGIDLDGRKGDAILATASGRVIFVGRQSGYGNVINIQHAKGWLSKYTHLNQTLVSKNQLVKAGEKIGGMGKSGQATGVHLHFELHYNKKAVDPLKFMRLR